jgi:hypothetical protein
LFFFVAGCGRQHYFFQISLPFCYMSANSSIPYFLCVPYLFLFICFISPIDVIFLQFYSPSDVFMICSTIAKVLFLLSYIFVPWDPPRTQFYVSFVVMNHSRTVNVVPWVTKFCFKHNYFCSFNFSCASASMFFSSWIFVIFVLRFL